ncbi:sesquipedalian-1-like [Plakobranchus ocellatus]|uniref:Sesquipedalian-1-like n=1 Tax=Plakobranchus ocellatus TaxID=259542 RepID=A0AAV4CF58_9GAST|nr:sesquipedalian-1-like [Plakobranchus ocellatus]
MKILNEKGLMHFASSGVPADKEGYLHKKGEINKGFQKRWFVLKGNLLFYYERKGDRDPLGVIILEGCTIELAEDADNFMFMINFAASGSRTYFLSAHSQQAMESWMKALSCAGYEYMKLMVSELQNKLKEVSENADSNIVHSADRDSKILGRMYLDTSVSSTDSRGYSKSPRSSKSSNWSVDRRTNPFNDLDLTAEQDPGDAFRNMSSVSSVEMVTWSLLGVHTFKEMHEFSRQQIEEYSAEWKKTVLNKASGT